MITITLNQIKAHNPCKDGWKKVLKANGADYDKPFPVASILDSNDLADTLWVTRCLPEHNMLWRRFAWWCATQVAPLATDSRVQQCLDTVDRYIKGEATDEELTTARAAADAAAYAYAAADAAYAAAAADAAYAAARAADAAYAAARAADAAYAAYTAYTAYAAARAAARAADAAPAAAYIQGEAQEAKLRQILTAGKWIDQ